MFAPNIFENMGFEYFTTCPDLTEDEWEEYENPHEWHKKWNPQGPEGYTLVSKHDSEDGPCALFVMPVTKFAKVLLDFGFTKEAQDAARADAIQASIEFQEWFEAKMSEVRNE